MPFAFRPSELDELHQQATVVSLLKRHQVLFAAIPNGHVRSKRQHIQAFQEGVSAGMPDILIFDAPPLLPGARGVALEMKRLSGRSRDVRKTQRRWLQDLCRRGWVPVVGYGAMDAIAQLCALGFFPGLGMTDEQTPHPIKVAKLRKLVVDQASPAAMLKVLDDQDKLKPKGKTLVAVLTDAVFADAEDQDDGDGPDPWED